MKKLLKRVFLALLLPPLTRAINPITQSQLASEYWHLRTESANKIPGAPPNFGYKIHSQCDEDGILQNIISRLAFDPGLCTFLEVGAGDGRENNTALLVNILGWRGVWVDPSDQMKNFAQLVGPQSSLQIITNKLSPDSDFSSLFNALDKVGCKPGNNGRSIGVLSLDIDSYDLDLLETLLSYLDPEILVLEYNASFPPPIQTRINYEDTSTWEGDNFYGASLSAQEVALRDKYMLVGTSMSGVNSFWVKNSHSKLFPKYPVEELYNPPRYHLTQLKWGHPANSIKWLKKV
jgi:hypothetical protein